MTSRVVCWDLRSRSVTVRPRGNTRHYVTNWVRASCRGNHKTNLRVHPRVMSNPMTHHESWKACELPSTCFWTDFLSFFTSHPGWRATMKYLIYLASTCLSPSWSRGRRTLCTLRRRSRDRCCCCSARLRRVSCILPCKKRQRGHEENEGERRAALQLCRWRDNNKPV